MYRFIVFLIAVLVLSACVAEELPAAMATATISAPTETPLAPTATQPGSKPWQVFDAADLAAQRAATGNAYLQFLNEDSLSMGLYGLPGGAVDGQGPHTNDEVYYVLQGAAMLTVGDEDIEVSAGSIVYVRAQVRHKFHSFSQDIQVLVIFSRVSSSDDDPDWLAFHVDDLLVDYDSSRNKFEQFLEVGSMRFGLYLLPQATGGDSALTHTFDEINIVVGGSGSFQMGADVVAVAAGDIMYVQAGVGHNFHSLDEDLFVLILFAGS